MSLQSEEILIIYIFMLLWILKLCDNIKYSVECYMCTEKCTFNIFLILSHLSRSISPSFIMIYLGILLIQKYILFYIWDWSVPWWEWDIQIFTTMMSFFIYLLRSTGNYFVNLSGCCLFHSAGPSGGDGYILWRIFLQWIPKQDSVFNSILFCAICWEALYSGQDFWGKIISLILSTFEGLMEHPRNNAL